MSIVTDHTTGLKAQYLYKSTSYVYKWYNACSIRSIHDRTIKKHCRTNVRYRVIRLREYMRVRSQQIQCTSKGRVIDLAVSRTCKTLYAISPQPGISYCVLLWAETTLLMH